jgi:hypothetical protein
MQAVVLRKTERGPVGYSEDSGRVTRDNEVQDVVPKRGFDDMLRQVILAQCIQELQAGRPTFVDAEAAILGPTDIGEIEITGY